MSRVPGYLRPDGFYIPLIPFKKLLGSKWDVFLTKLTLVYQPRVGPVVKTRMYAFVTRGVTQYIQLPRTMVTTLSTVVHVDVRLNGIVENNAVLIGTLFPGQLLVVNRLMEIFTPERAAAGTACAMLDMKAGEGKTYVIGGIIAQLCINTIIVVPRKILMYQAITDLRKLLSGVSIGYYDSKNKKKLNNPPLDEQQITCIVINSVRNLPAEFFVKYPLVVLDETHMYCSKKNSIVFKKCNSPYRLGCTGTAEDRADQTDLIAHKELAFDGIIRAEDIPGFTYGGSAFNCQARLIHYYGSDKYTENLTHESTGMIFTHYMHNQFIADPDRLRIAVDELLALYDWRGEDSQEHSIYVFAEEIGILTIAKNAFVAELLSRDRDDVVESIDIETSAALFTGGLTEAGIEKAKGARVLFTTYGYGGTGVSIIKMSAILLLTPRKANMKQIFARILRRGSDISIPRVIVDIVDARTALQYQLRTRKKAYDFYGFKTKKITVGV